jgi:hypothetical protein
MEAARSRAHIGRGWIVELQWISGEGGKVAIGGHGPGKNMAGETLVCKVALDEGGREKVNLISEATNETKGVLVVVGRQGRAG